jgi:glycosyltransferase involved in cell wall biosynthesis
MPDAQPTDPAHPAASGAGYRRVLIDALAARFGGTAYAAVHLALQLAKRPDVDTVTVVARRGSIVERGLAAEDSVACILLPDRSRLELIRRLAWEGLRLRAVVAGERSDVVISMSGMLPQLPGCRVISLLFNPVMYENRGAANRLRRWAVRRTARDADYVAAPSQYMADLVSTSTGRECAVVPLGVDHGVFAPADAPGAEVLYVADFYAHKRHDLLLDAWLLLPAPRPLLHLVGNPSADPRTHAALLARIETLPEAGSIVLEHGISLDRLVNAYHRARVFVMPSERESFCMPLVESMACGVPAVVRGLPSLRETGGGGAQYVDGDDPAEWAAVMQPLIEDGVGRDSAREAALQAAARFSWATLAADLAGQL